MTLFYLGADATQVTKSQLRVPPPVMALESAGGGAEAPAPALSPAPASPQCGGALPWEEFQHSLHAHDRALAHDKLVVADAVPGAARGWDGSVVRMSTRSMMTFYPSTPEHSSTFSDKLMGAQAALVRPSVPFWQWLVADSGAGGGAGAGDGGAAGGGSARTWQMRGGIKLSALELALLTGPRFSAAICEGKVRYKASSIWAGAGQTRTPLHVDWVHAVIYQIAGTKEVFLADEAAVDEAVARGSLPEGVLTDGNTDNSAHLTGTLADVYGLDADGRSSRVVAGRVVVLRPGDCLLLPAGLYHDVQCSEQPALSLTIRFDVAPFACPSACPDGGGRCARPFGHHGAHIPTAAEQDEDEPEADDVASPPPPSSPASSSSSAPTGSTLGGSFAAWREKARQMGPTARERPASQPSSMTLGETFAEWRNRTLGHVPTGDGPAATEAPTPAAGTDGDFECD